MADISTCVEPTCGIVVQGKAEACPKCGGPMRRIGEAKWRGWVLLVLGLFLMLFMGVIAFNLLPSLLAPGKDMGGGARFSGDADQAQMVLGLFGAIILFGFVTAANGAYWIATGRRSKTFTVLTLALAAGLALIAVLFKKTMG
jgi:hypothetical protein